jgi:hypothetical protein
MEEEGRRTEAARGRGSLRAVVGKVPDLAEEIDSDPALDRIAPMGSERALPGYPWMGDLDLSPFRPIAEYSEATCMRCISRPAATVHGRGYGRDVHPTHRATATSRRAVEPVRLMHRTADDGCSQPAFRSGDA